MGQRSSCPMNTRPTGNAVRGGQRSRGIRRSSEAVGSIRSEHLPDPAHLHPVVDRVRRPRPKRFVTSPWSIGTGQSVPTFRANRSGTHRILRPARGSVRPSDRQGGPARTRLAPPCTRRPDPGGRLSTSSGRRPVSCLRIWAGDTNRPPEARRPTQRSSESPRPLFRRQILSEPDRPLGRVSGWSTV
jgi:hypothetical protein